MKPMIIVDSTCDISRDIAEQLNLEVVPLIVTFGEKSYKDDSEISKNQFYEMLKDCDELPVTSQPNPEDFIKVLTKYEEDIVYIGVSKVLSGTYQSASIAKDLLERDNIYLVDSENVTCGIELLIRLAVRLRDEGKSAKEIAETLEIQKSKVQVYALVDTLKYLIKGGRISKTVGAIGGMLNLKPIVSVIGGNVAMIDKVRGRKSTLEKIIKISKECEINYDFPTIVTYTSNKLDLEEILTEMDKQDLIVNKVFSQVGSVVGTHLGTDCVGLAFFKK